MAQDGLGAWDELELELERGGRAGVAAAGRGRGCEGGRRAAAALRVRETTANYTYASLIFAGIVVVSILLERGMQAIKYVAQNNPQYKQMVQTIFGELTILGILSFGLTLER